MTRAEDSFYYPKKTTPFNFLSLGAGVQSSTMALMAAKGEITPMPDAAIFADTQAEPEEVYKWLRWLKAELPFPTYTVTKGSLTSAQLVVKQTRRSADITWIKTLIPAYIKSANGGIGLLGRKCTSDYKVGPILKKVRELAGIKRGQKEVTITQWLGISSDEKQRMKALQVDWSQNRWPLIELNMTRRHCLEWMDANGYPIPPRSACIYCPFHSEAEWKRLKETSPDEFSKAVQFEKDLQAAAEKATTLLGVPYLHESCQPLETIDLSHAKDQFEFMNDGMANECEGMCGV